MLKTAIGPIQFASTMKMHIPTPEINVENNTAVAHFDVTVTHCSPVVQSSIPFDTHSRSNNRAAAAGGCAR